MALIADLGYIIINYIAKIHNQNFTAQLVIVTELEYWHNCKGDISL